MNRLSRNMGEQALEIHHRALESIEGANGEIFVHANDYPTGYLVPRHIHSRTQLLCSFAGVALVETDRGRFMIPPGHALLIPPRLPHAVEMMSGMEMKSVYVTPSLEALVKDRPLVLEVTDLARSLLLEAIRLQETMEGGRKAELVQMLLVEEVMALDERPLGLPFPLDRRLAALCAAFVNNPSPNARLDDWARELAMSRRTFTRFFRRETGISLVTWRQQASVFACLPRLAEGMTVTQVALEAGYENAAAFTTMFRRVLGNTPRNYMGSAWPFGGRPDQPRTIKRERA